MSGLSMRLQLGGQDQAITILDRVLGRLTHTLPLMRSIAAYLVNSTRQRFEDQVSPEGKPWKPSIRAQLDGGQTLVQHGHLRDSFTDAFGEDFAQVGTSDIRASVFQFGATIRAKTSKGLVFQLPGGGWRRMQQVTIAARPMLGVSAEDREEIIALGEDHLLGGDE